MSLLDNSLILERIYALSNFETKKNLEKYATKVEFATCDSQPIKTIQLYQRRNSSNEPIPCFWCMWQEKI